MTKIEIFRVSANFQWFVSLVVVSSCLIKYSDRPSYIKTLGFYGIISFLFSTVAKFAVSGSQVNGILNTYVFCEVIILLILFFLAGRDKLFRSLIVAGCISYVLIFAGAYLYYPSYVFSIIRVARDLLMIFFAISYFIYLLRQLPEEDLLKFPMFWINAAVVIFFSGVFVLSYFRDYIVLVLKDDTAGFWAFRNFFSTAYWLVLAYAGWLNLKTIHATQSLN